MGEGLSRVETSLWGDPPALEASSQVVPQEATDFVTLVPPLEG